MSAPSGQNRPTVALFVTCMVDALYPRLGLAAVDVLERHGAEVVFPADQTCCGHPAFNTGHRSEASDMARHFIKVFSPLVERGDVDAIVTPSGSCAAMVRHSYETLLQDADDKRERDLAAQIVKVTYELSEYLVDVLGATASDASFSGTLTYHPCCHLLRDLRVDAQPRRLLATIRDASIVELPGAEECCGFGGLFALKNAPISTAMARRKARNLDRCGADIVVMNDVGCIAHMNGMLERENHHSRAVHIAELLNTRDADDDGELR